MQTKPATNINELIEQTAEAIATLRDDPRRYNQCKEICNGVGKVIAAMKVQYEYALARKAVPELDIPFLNECLKPVKQLKA